MPICSRVYEIPSNGLNLKKTDKNYLVNLKKSFVEKTIKKKITNIVFLLIINGEDCIKYKGYHFHVFLSF